MIFEISTHLIQHELSVRRGWSAESGDGVCVQDVDGFLAAESTAVVVDEECSAAVPGGEEGPGCFGPALLGEDPVDVAGFQAMEVFPCDCGSEAVAYVVVLHHLWIACCS